MATPVRMVWNSKTNGPAILATFEGSNGTTKSGKSSPYTNNPDGLLSCEAPDGHVHFAKVSFYRSVKQASKSKLPENAAKLTKAQLLELVRQMAGA